MWTREQCIADLRTDDALIAAAVVETQLPVEESGRATGAVASLLWRSGPDLLRRAILLTESADWMERELGVDLLGQIRDPAFRDTEEREAWSTPSIVIGYLDETMTVLLARAETETYPDVVDSLAWAFGDRQDPRGIEPLTRLAADERVHIRYAATRSLNSCSCFVDDDADPADVATARAIAERIAAPLVALAGDPDGDIRDWALFALHQLGLDTPLIRDTFLAHVDDPHHDAMTEALRGLANLGDPRGLEPLRKHLESGEDSRPVIEACEAYGDERLVPGLQALRDDDFDEDNDELDAALATCRGNVGWQPPDRRVL